MTTTSRARRWVTVTTALVLVAGCGSSPASPTPTPGSPTGSAGGSLLPSGSPSSGPSLGASGSPVTAPTIGPSFVATSGPTAGATAGPTGGPTGGPTAAPTTATTAGPIPPPTAVPTAGPGAVAWTRHFGTTTEDAARGIDADSTGITVVGDTQGSLPGPLQGPSDAFIRRFDLAGTFLWGHHVGTPRQDWARDVASDAGGLTILGQTDGSFTSTSGTNAQDLFLRRFDRTGTVLWTRQHVTPFDETPGGIAADATGLTVVGTIRGATGDTSNATAPPVSAQVLVLRYDFSGTLLWSLELGSTKDDDGGAVAIDAAGFTVAGGTDGDFEGPNAGPYSDAFVRRYDNERRVLWTRQWGQQGDDSVLSLAADDGGVTAVGYTNADAYGNEPSQAFIRRYDRAGNLLWGRIFGSPDSEIAWGVAADAAAITVTGYTYGTMDGTHSGAFDVFVRRYDRAGNVAWGTQFGTSGADLGLDVAADPTGFSIVGHTNGALGGPALGELDVFVRRYTR